MTDRDLTRQLCEQIRNTAADNKPLTIQGAGSKRFLTGDIPGVPLETTAHSGVVNYAPQELVLTVRAGTPVREVEALLAEHDQMLAFEPPHFSENATIGGTLAAGLSGPRRAHAGSARDFILGTRIINGKGEELRFGGEVIKNVAGYDASRLMVGAFGTLGVILEASFKVLPRPACERTIIHAVPDAAAALKKLRKQLLTPLPISASALFDGQMYLRLSGAEASVRHAAAQVGGPLLEQADTFWEAIREQQHAFFDDPRPLWRLSMPPAAALVPEPVVVAADRLIEWDGALRWLKSTSPADEIFAAASKRGGHATLWRNAAADTPRRQSLAPELAALHRQIKTAFDPQGLLNPGVFYGQS